MSTYLCSSVSPQEDSPGPPKSGLAGTSVKQGNFSRAQAIILSFSSSVIVQVLQISFPPTFSTFTAYNKKEIKSKIGLPVILLLIKYTEQKGTYGAQKFTLNKLVGLNHFRCHLVYQLRSLSQPTAWCIEQYFIKTVRMVWWTSSHIIAYF